MSCQRSREIDLAAYLVEPTAPEWNEFRAHFLTCPDCAAELASWSTLENSLRAASAEPGLAHPPEELLVAFQTNPDRLSSENRGRVRDHLEGCAPCRDGLAALASFDFAALRRDAPSSERRELFGRLLGWIRELAVVPSIPVPALVAALLLLLAIPVVLVLRSAVDVRGPGGGEAPAPIAVAPPAVAEPEPVPELESEPAQELRLAAESDQPTEPDRGAGAETTQPPDPALLAQDSEPASRAMVVAMASLGPPLYAPPYADLHSTRLIGRTRGVAADVPALLALVPDHTGRTLRESPTLYWFLSGDSDVRIDFTLIDESSVDPLLKLSLEAPVRAGIHPLRLSEHGVRLDPGVSYRWFVALVLDPTDRSNDVISGGTVERIQTGEELRARLEQEDASPSHVYAGSGVWYDALGSLSRLIEEFPEEGRLRTQRAALLEQVGLREAAAYDRRFAGSDSRG